MFKRTLLSGLIMAAILAVSEFLAIKYDLFWRLWWYDIPLHLIGGISLGILGLWFFDSLRMRFSLLSDFRATVALVLLFVLCGGVLWEVFENVLGITFNTVGSYHLDILKDLVMDILGSGLVLYLYARDRRLTLLRHAQ